MSQGQRFHKGLWLIHQVILSQSLSQSYFIPHLHTTGIQHNFKEIQVTQTIKEGLLRETQK